MFRTYQFRMLPNAGERSALERILLDNCETYNAALQERRDAWKLQRKSISLYDQYKQISDLRKDPQFQWIAAEIQRDPLRRVDRAFKAFFLRSRNGQTPGYPRFRSKSRYNSFTLADHHPVVRAHSIKIPLIGDIRTRSNRPISGTPKTCTIRRDGKRWTASVVCDIGPAPEKCAVSNPVGIDVGLTALATLSDGTVIENPRWTRKHESRIAAAGRRLATKQRRSKNRVRTVETLRRAHQRAADARRNYLHHISKRLVENYDLIAFEDLKIKNMAANRQLSKSIMDAAWGLLIWCIIYKAESAGKWAVPVNPRGTSQRCSGCGAVVPKTLADRIHACSCGLTIGRDHNSGLNIKALGMSAAGIVPSKSIAAMLV
jgi:putative transposase